MSTLRQASRWRGRKTRHPKAAVLRRQPNKKGDVRRVMIITPKKPNSARRPAVKILMSSGIAGIAHVPGPGHNLRRHGDTLVRGRGARDLPGVNISCIRGKYDLLAVLEKTKRRSIYGVSRPAHKVTKLRRRFRGAL